MNEKKNVYRNKHRTNNERTRHTQGFSVHDNSHVGRRKVLFINMGHLIPYYYNEIAAINQNHTFSFRNHYDVHSNKFPFD